MPPELLSDLNVVGDKQQPEITTTAAVPCSYPRYFAWYEMPTARYGDLLGPGDLYEGGTCVAGILIG